MSEEAQQQRQASFFMLWMLYNFKQKQAENKQK
jgi:hypothetical protein